MTSVKCDFIIKLDSHNLRSDLESKRIPESPTFAKLNFEKQIRRRQKSMLNCMRANELM